MSIKVNIKYTRSKQDKKNIKKYEEKVVDVKFVIQFK